MNPMKIFVLNGACVFVLSACVVTVPPTSNPSPPAASMAEAVTTVPPEMPGASPDASVSVSDVAELKLPTAAVDSLRSFALDLLKTTLAGCITYGNCW